MNCLHPFAIRDKKTFELRWIPCGKCPNCLQQKRSQLSARIYLENLIEGNHAYFITLTYNEDNLPKIEDGRQCFSKRHCQDFMRALRYRFRSKFDISRIRYFLTCELGELYGRCHYHLILMIPNYVPLKVMNSVVCDSWPYGFSYVERASLGAINYCTQYALKEDSYLYKQYEKGDPQKPFRLFSNKPGLCGTSKCLAFIEDYIRNDGENTRFSIPVGKGSVPLPKYLKEKLPSGLKESFKIHFKEWYESNVQSMIDLNTQNMDIFCDALESGLDDKSARSLVYQKDREIIANRKNLRTLRKNNRHKGKKTL